MGFKFDLSLIEVKSLLLATIFSFIWGFKGQLSSLLPIILHKFYNYNISMAAVASGFLSGVGYIQITILFAVFFYICNRNFIDKIGGTIISVVIGNVIGFWIGYLVSAGYVLYSMPTVYAEPFTSINVSLGSEVISLLLYEIAAIASAFLIREWDQKLEQAGFNVENAKRPGTAFVAFILYAVFGTVSLILAFLFAVFGHLMSELLAKLKIFAVSALFVNGAALLAVAYGLYTGKRWGWLFAFILSTMGIIIGINGLVTCVIRGSSAELWVLMTSLVTLTLSFIVLACLLPLATRKYFRFLNVETGQSQ